MNENMHESMEKVHEWFFEGKRINFGVNFHLGVTKCNLGH